MKLSVEPSPSEAPSEDRLDVNSTEYVTPSQLEAIKKDVDLMKGEAQSFKKDTMAVFGIFAALLVFASAEIDILSSVPRVSLKIGITSFLLASMLLFVLGVHQVTKSEDGKTSFTGTVYRLLWFFLAFAVVAFIYAAVFPSGLAQDWFSRLFFCGC